MIKKECITMSHKLQLFKALNHLYWPILGIGCTYSFTPFINTLMLGHLSPELLAAGGLVNICYGFIMIIFWGIFTTLGTLISRHKGGESFESISHLFKSALVLAGVFGSIIALFFFLAMGGLLQKFHQAPEVLALAKPYINIMSLVMIPSLLLTVTAQLFYGLGKPRIVMLIAFIFMPINIGLNYLLMYGKCGLPAMGIEGLGVGSLITTSLNVLSLFWVIATQAPYKNYLHTGVWLNATAAKELLMNGIPAGLVWLVEVGFFSGIALLMGMISVAALAAHELVFQIDMLVFALAANMGQALQILLGESVGKKQYQDIMPAYWIAQIFLMGLIGIVMLVTWCCPHIIIHLGLGANTSLNAETMEIALSLLLIMPIFLLLDSLGFMTFSALRALKANRFSLAVVIGVYWVIILPILGVGVVHYHYFNPTDLWWFLCVGATLSFALQFWRLTQITSKI
jgi:MATE family multidrug resistance protein